MKQIRHILVGFAVFFLGGIFSLSAFAQSYRDNFHVLNEDNWVLWGEFSIWKTEKGFLKTWIQGEPDLIGGIQGPHPTIELLQFKGLGTDENFDIFISRDEVIQRQIKKLGYENFTITVKDIGTKHANFGIALGKRFSEHPRDDPFFYLFSTDQIITAFFSGWGGVAINTGRKETFHPTWAPWDNPWDTLELPSMELRFNSGRFQWFAEGEKRADFEDPEFSSAEILGFVIIGDGLSIGHAWVDAFTISGPGLSVSPQAKLATTWGKLKQRR